MKPDFQYGPSSDGAVLRGEAEWFRFQADVTDHLAAKADEAAALEHEHRSQLASEFPEYIDPVPAPSDGFMPLRSEAGVDGVESDTFFERDVESFMALAAERPFVSEISGELPSKLIDRQQAFRDAWMRLTDPEVVLPEFARPHLTEFSPEGPDAVPLSNVSLKAFVRPTGPQVFSVTPSNTRGVWGKAVGTAPDHMGHVSRLGNIRGEAPASGLTARATHQIVPVFLEVRGTSIFNPPITVKGNLHFWVELEWETAETSTFLAPRPGARRPGAAFVRAFSAIAYQKFDISTRTTVTRGAVPLWSADAEWYPFMSGPTVKLAENHKRPNRGQWLHIDTGEYFEFVADNVAKVPFFFVGLVDRIVASNTGEMVSYMEMRNLYRLKQVVVGVS